MGFKFFIRITQFLKIEYRSFHYKKRWTFPGLDFLHVDLFKILQQTGEIPIK